MIVNHKKIRRLMREHDLQPRRRRRYRLTTDSDHDQPIYPNRTKGLTIDGPNQLWVADITWSRRAVGYAISRSIDVRLTLAALALLWHFYSSCLRICLLQWGHR